MSELNYLEKLLDGTEVEWKALGDVTSVLRGKRLTKNLLSAEEKFPVFHGGLEPLGYYNKSNRPANTVMIINVGASAGTVGYSTVDFWSSDGCFCLEHNELLNNRFLYFALIGYQSLLKSKVRVAGIPTLDAIVVNKLLIPIPCPENPEKSLAIQSEIVRILDKFTALTAELTAELNMRKKQYNYYRDQLLSFKEGEVEWKTLGEVAQFKRGTAITQKQTTPGEIPVVANGPIPTYFHSESNRQGETIVIARSGAYAGYVSFWDQPIFLTDAFSVHSDLKIVKPKFIYHVLQNKQEHIHAMKKGAGVPHVRVKEFETYDIPIPPITEQDRIVSILDKFDTLTNSITEGLPREIELRQKQYEYYRDLLFSFPKPETVSK
ncbi:restriction endonuclease subunit S [Escherichia coli]|jgi:type I restriction enzyme S subunit|uniref:restriction endonuclease subunit S n=1 Tax=Escherichia coli TaxID=562 RepID=UPI0009B9A57B|nr:restriction endonuclease subunit S [Escherichia coli]EEW8419463.1 restriction endonuclease subunit S [Escherichia coli]EFE6993709.1 restriction endonuclease subunit S [Escherichia coli]EGE0492623.1 restriction endonuclease subunit S [Escherichia coli]EHX9398835.1 restriction endonuclease subunit S [Escherichia coli]EJZ6004346.1 restriction endonuclease subunit S [Escherichia coli]